MWIVLVVPAAVAVLAVVAGLADRSVAAFAERKASAVLSAQFGHPPAVRLHHVPFLTQALRGRYRDVEVAGGGLRIGQISGATLEARLANVWLPPRGLLNGSIREVPCEHVVGRLVLPYGEIARASRLPGLTLEFVDGHLLATAAVPVPGISQLARVSGRARLSVEANTVWLQVTRPSVAGLSATALVLGQLMPRLTVPIPLPALPWGLRIDGLDPGPDGLVVRASASAAVLKATNDPGAGDAEPAY